MLSLAMFDFNSSLGRQSEQVDARLYVRAAEENKIEREFESRS